MIIKTNIDTLRKNYATRIKNLEKASINIHRKAARFMGLTAKSLAPKQSGALIAAIRTRHGKKSSTVRAGVPIGSPKGFPYQLWVEGVIPTVRGRTYPEVRKTALSDHFWTDALIATRNKFPQIIRVESKNALKVRI